MREQQIKVNSFNLVFYRKHSNSDIGLRTSDIDSASGDHAGGVPPVPIPNTEVKTSRADDTWGASPWESRSLPGKQAKDYL